METQYDKWIGRKIEDIPASDSWAWHWPVVDCETHEIIGIFRTPDDNGDEFALADLVEGEIIIREGAAQMMVQV